MIRADIDPSLCTGEPLDRLDDGFSPPPHEQQDLGAGPTEPPPAELTAKSPF